MSRSPAVRLRPLLVPVEHGGWGFLLEPIIIALIAVPGLVTVLLSLAALALFLSRQPLKIAIDDVRHRRRVPRTRVAVAIAAGCLLAAMVALAGATMAATDAFWPALLLAAPLALVPLWFDSRSVSRHVVPELAGAKALGGVAAAAGLAAGLSLPLALSLWASALIRVLPAVVTIRERVSRLHGNAADRRAPLTAHLLALAGAVALALVNLMPWGIASVALVLALRAGWDLRPGAPANTAIRIGIRELVSGMMAAVAIGSIWALWRTPA
jgi:YwiC-like protein